MPPLQHNNYYCWLPHSSIQPHRSRRRNDLQQQAAAAGVVAYITLPRTLLKQGGCRSRFQHVWALLAGRMPEYCFQLHTGHAGGEQARLFHRKAVV